MGLAFNGQYERMGSARFSILCEFIEKKENGCLILPVPSQTSGIRHFYWVNIRFLLRKLPQPLDQGIHIYIYMCGGGEG